MYQWCIDACLEAEEVALTILRQVIEEKLTPYNIEMGCVLTSNQR
jgi:hypothetical protein